MIGLWVSRLETHTHTRTQTVGTSEVCLQIEIKDSMFELYPMTSIAMVTSFPDPAPADKSSELMCLLISDLHFAKNCEGWCRVVGLTPRGTFDCAYMCTMKAHLNCL